MATWYAHEHSDIGLAIRSGREASTERFQQLRDAIEEIRTLYTIDVVDAERAGDSLRDEIARHGKRL